MTLPDKKTNAAIPHPLPCPTRALQNSVHVLAITLVALIWQVPHCT